MASSSKKEIVKTIESHYGPLTVHPTLTVSSSLSNGRMRMKVLFLPFRTALENWINFLKGTTSLPVLCNLRIYGKRGVIALSLSSLVCGGNLWDCLALLGSIQTTPSPLDKWYYVQFVQEDWELLFVAL
jgi:hypothetical protein